MRMTLKLCMMSLTVIPGLGTFGPRSDLEESATERAPGCGWYRASNEPWGSAWVMNNIKREAQSGADGEAKRKDYSEGGGDHGRT